MGNKNSHARTSFRERTGLKRRSGSFASLDHALVTSRASLDSGRAILPVALVEPTCAQQHPPVRRRPRPKASLGTHGGLMIDGRGEDNSTVAPGAQTVRGFRNAITLRIAI
jgi:hypothetical protein